jgi:NAD(P)-dependent dehydrogenase (short-subunit alcohol dehydrogenase family)
MFLPKKPIVMKTLLKNIVLFFSLTIGLAAAYTNDIGLSLSFDSNRLNLKLSVSEVFNTLKNNVTNNYGTNNLEIHQKFESRIARLTYTCNFGDSGKTRHHQSAADEEKGRVKGANYKESILIINYIHQMKTNRKVALVTGASSGMGNQIAKTLLGAGYIVYGAARRLDKMANIQELGAWAIEMDLTDDISIRLGVQTIIDIEGKIDILVNNAGFGSYGAVEDVAMFNARRQLEVNVIAAARLSQLVIPYMREQQWGRIINITSIGGKFANALGGWYHASKFALEGLSDSLRNEVKQFGIDVVVIEPGAIKSDWDAIATKNLLRDSGHGYYREMAQRFIKGLRNNFSHASEPAVISDIVLKAIRAKAPKTRYAGGFFARPMLFLRRILSDRMMDKFLNSQLS